LLNKGNADKCDIKHQTEMDINKEVAAKYQVLFDFMDDEYGLVLTISEMDEIIIAAQKVADAVSANDCSG